MKLYFLLAIACSKSTAREGAQLDIKRTVVSKAINLLFSNIKIGPGATCKGSPGDEGYLVMREGKREGGVVVSSKWGSSIPYRLCVTRNIQECTTYPLFPPSEFAKYLVQNRCSKSSGAIR